MGIVSMDQQQHRGSDQRAFTVVVEIMMKHNTALVCELVSDGQIGSGGEGELIVRSRRGSVDDPLLMSDRYSTLDGPQLKVTFVLVSQLLSKEHSKRIPFGHLISGIRYFTEWFILYLIVYKLR